MTKQRYIAWLMPVSAVGATLSYTGTHGWFVGLLACALWFTAGMAWAKR